MSGSSRDKRIAQKPKYETTQRLTPHELFQQRYDILAAAYRRGRQPPRPKSKIELDVLKEKHQFIRSNDVEPSALSWEDALAYKYYNSLFREFAIVNLKHYRSGAIAMRWRTENELLEGIGHLTCASMRCKYHLPDPRLVAEQEGGIDPEMESPLVKIVLEQQEMQFGYMEEGVKKSALVKVTLCRKCSQKLRYGKEKSKRDRQATAIDGAEAQRDPEEAIDARAPAPDMPEVSESDSDGYTPAPPPDLDRRSTTKTSRRSASPVRKR